jgi:hypothetical protein
MAVGSESTPRCLRLRCRQCPWRFHLLEDVAPGCISADSGRIDLLSIAIEAFCRDATVAHRKNAATHRRRAVDRDSRQSTCRHFCRRYRDPHGRQLRWLRLRSDIHAPTFSEFGVASALGALAGAVLKPWLDSPSSTIALPVLLVLEGSTELAQRLPHLRLGSGVCWMAR